MFLGEFSKIFQNNSWWLDLTSKHKLTKSILTIFQIKQG